jgi:hypothetical protein
MELQPRFGAAAPKSPQLAESPFVEVASRVERCSIESLEGGTTSNSGVFGECG